MRNSLSPWDTVPFISPRKGTVLSKLIGPRSDLIFVRLGFILVLKVLQSKRPIPRTCLLQYFLHIEATTTTSLGALWGRDNFLFGRGFRLLLFFGGWSLYRRDNGGGRACGEGRS